MKRRERFVASLASGGALAGLAWGLVLSLSATVFGQVSGSPSAYRNEVVARVDGAAITAADLNAEVETIYPSNAGHGGLDPEKMKGIRSKALEELIVRELAYRQAVKLKVVVPWPKPRRNISACGKNWGRRHSTAIFRPAASPASNT